MSALRRVVVGCCGCRCCCCRGAVMEPALLVGEVEATDLAEVWEEVDSALLGRPGRLGAVSSIVSMAESLTMGGEGCFMLSLMRVS